MNTYKVCFKETGYFSKLLIDYITQNNSLDCFYGLYPHIANFEKQIERKQYHASTRKILHEVISRQYRHMESIPEHQIDLLAQEHTYTVTTGHQLNIFSGPLYFIYKIITTINLANELRAKYPDYHFVPVYWMASEDHDFEEISSFKLFNKSFKWEKLDASGAVGDLDPKELISIIEDIKEIPSFFKNAYLNSDSLASATRKYVHELFGAKGLLVIDANDSNLKKYFAPIIKDDLLEHKAHKTVRLQSEKLRIMGYKTQVSPRQINLFYLEKRLRKRLEKISVNNQTVYQIVNDPRKFQQQEILDMLEKYPDRFSPNVILRPLYQEFILPNLAYIGGPAEIAYWLQLKTMFDKYQTAFPILVPRNCALLINPGLQKKIQKLSLQPNQLLDEVHIIKHKLISSLNERPVHIDVEIETVQQQLISIQEKSRALDASLQGFFVGESKKIEKILESMGKKIQRSGEHKHQTAINQLKKIKDRLFPNGSLQERTENMLNFYINDETFIEKLCALFEPLDFRFQIILL